MDTWIRIPFILRVLKKWLEVELASLDRQPPEFNEAPAGARIELSGVGKKFSGSAEIFRDFSLLIEPGEFVSLLGPSGCGKSTLIRIIGQLEPVDAGRVRLDAMGRRHFKGYVPQDANLLPWRNVLGNVLLPLELTGQSGHTAQRVAMDALEKVGLADACDLYPNQLSGGMRMRVSVARALVTNPSLLLLDEPFSALDEATRLQLQEDLRVLWQKMKMTVVLVTHSFTEAVFVSNRVIVLSRSPAEVVLDHHSQLPEVRTRRLRSEQGFIEEIEKVQAAMQRQEERR